MAYLTPSQIHLDRTWAEHWGERETENATVFLVALCLARNQDSMINKRKKKVDFEGRVAIFSAGDKCTLYISDLRTQVSECIYVK